MEDKLVAVTGKNFLTIYDPERVNRELVDVRSAEDALSLSTSAGLPSLARLRRDFGAQKVETIIKLYLVELSELVNLTRPLREKQIEAIAAEVVSTYYALTIADIHVIFRRARNGEFGELYESLDMPKVMRWFSDYFAERCEAAANNSIREAERNYDKGGNITAERMQKHFNKLEDKINKKL